MDHDQHSKSKCNPLVPCAAFDFQSKSTTPETNVLMKTSITTILYVCLNIVGCGLNNYFAELL